MSSRRDRRRGCSGIFFRDGDQDIYASHYSLQPNILWQNNGSGAATLELVVGTSYSDRRDGVLTDGGMNPAVVGVGNPYRITIGAVTTTIEERDGLLTVLLELDGQVAMSIRRQ